MCSRLGGNRLRLGHPIWVWVVKPLVSTPTPDSLFHLGYQFGINHDHRLSFVQYKGFVGLIGTNTSYTDQWGLRNVAVGEEDELTVNNNVPRASRTNFNLLISNLKDQYLIYNEYILVMSKYLKKGRTIKGKDGETLSTNLNFSVFCQSLSNLTKR